MPARDITIRAGLADFYRMQFTQYGLNFDLLAPKAEERPRPQLEFEQGEVVSVVGGAFNGYSGPVATIDVDKQRVTVLLDLFGRETPVELTFDQVTKL